MGKPWEQNTFSYSLVPRPLGRGSLGTRLTLNMHNSSRFIQTPCNEITVFVADHFMTTCRLWSNTLVNLQSGTCQWKFFFRRVRSLLTFQKRASFRTDGRSLQWLTLWYVCIACKFVSASTDAILAVVFNCTHSCRLLRGMLTSLRKGNGFLNASWWWSGNGTMRSQGD